jgi:hypothetical protein
MRQCCVLANWVYCHQISLILTGSGTLSTYQNYNFVEIYGTTNLA